IRGQYSRAECRKSSADGPPDVANSNKSDRTLAQGSARNLEPSAILHLLRSHLELTGETQHVSEGRLDHRFCARSVRITILDTAAPAGFLIDGIDAGPPFCDDAQPLCFAQNFVVVLVVTADCSIDIGNERQQLACGKALLNGWHDGLDVVSLEEIEIIRN